MSSSYAAAVILVDTLRSQFVPPRHGRFESVGGNADLRVQLVDYRQHNCASVRAAEPDLLRRLLIVLLLRVHDVLHVRLRVPVVQREQRRLHLHHDPVARQEHVIDIG